jgi:hypothetical protein
MSKPKFNFTELLEILTLEYYTREQINYLAMKLIDKNCNSIYLQSVMAGDLKTIKDIIKARQNH